MAEETSSFIRRLETVPLDGAPSLFGQAGEPFPGEFQLMRPLGKGGFGEVWLAHDPALDRAVALKFVRLAAPLEGQREAMAVLRNDARLLAAVVHPNIVQIHAWRETAAGLPCLVLQYVGGGSLADRVKQQGPLGWEIAGRYIADIGAGLLRVHARGIIHRDIKPANMLHDLERDEAMLTDFGIAARLAEPGSVAGTVPYMAPEAFDGQVSPALDVYALAASLFFLVTGDVPFRGPGAIEILDQSSWGLPAHEPRLAAVPAALERLLRVGLAPRPQARPDLAAFVGELRGTLNQLLADSLLPTRPAGGGVEVRLIVSRPGPGLNYEPVASSAKHSAALRDMKRVPAEPARVTLRTGERVRLEVVANHPGYVTVFNIGPTGNLNLLYPTDAGRPGERIAAHQVVGVLEVELTPPAGKERLFALWTRQPLPIRLEELPSLVEAGETAPYRATRDMARVGKSVRQLDARDRQVVVLELDHVEGARP